MSDIIATGAARPPSPRSACAKWKFKINGKEFTDYFPSLSMQNTILRPLEIASAVHRFDVEAKPPAVESLDRPERCAISRALLRNDESFRGSLREEGLLTRDPRMKERKKSGQPGARKRFQFSKR